NRKRQRVGAALNFVVDTQIANIRKRSRKGLERWDQVVASAHLKTLHFSLTRIQDQVAEVISQFVFVLLHVRERTIQSLLFTGEQHKANRTPRPLSYALNRIGRAKRCSRS